MASRYGSHPSHWSKYPIPTPNTQSRGGFSLSGEVRRIYRGDIYAYLAVCIKASHDPGVDFPSGEGRRVYRGDIYAYLAVSIKANPPPSHLAVPSLLVLRFPRRCYPLPPPCRQGPLRHPLAAIVRPEPRGDSSAGTSGRIYKIVVADLSGEARMARDGGSSPQVRRGTASITRRSYRQPLECLLGKGGVYELFN